MVPTTRTRRGVLIAAICAIVAASIIGEKIILLPSLLLVLAYAGIWWSLHHSGYLKVLSHKHWRIGVMVGFLIWSFSVVFRPFILLFPTHIIITLLQLNISVYDAYLHALLAGVPVYGLVAGIFGQRQRPNLRKAAIFIAIAFFGFAALLYGPYILLLS